MIPCEIQHGIHKELFTFLQDYMLYNEPIEEIDFDESLIDGGYIDSIGIITLVTFIEKTFQFKVFDKEILPENFESINRINRYIDRKLEERNR